MCQKSKRSETIKSTTPVPLTLTVTSDDDAELRSRGLTRLWCNFCSEESPFRHGYCTVDHEIPHLT